MTREKERLPSKDQVTIYIPPEVKEKLAEIAKEESRSVSGQILAIIKKFIAEYKNGNQ